MPSPGGQVSGMEEVCHPVGLPKGYHAATRGQSFTTPAGGCIEGCPRVAAR